MQLSFHVEKNTKVEDGDMDVNVRSVWKRDFSPDGLSQQH